MLIEEIDTSLKSCIDNCTGLLSVFGYPFASLKDIDLYSCSNPYICPGHLIL